MKRALVTGGAKRLGRYISIALSEFGYDVAITFNTSTSEVKSLKRIIEANGSKFLAIKANFEFADSSKKVFNSYCKEWKDIDLLINNAGVFSADDFLKITVGQWEKTFAVNLRSVFFITQKFSTIMKNGGLVINISSIGGFEIWKNRILYNTSKSAQITLTKCLAKELAPKIRVNSIAPGTVWMGEEETEADRIYKNKIPINRYGIPDEIIETIKFIINNKYLTGVIIPVDGGKLLT